MAGGTFKSQNKIRPGAYINFKAVAKPLSSLGTRGVMTMPVAMSWGDTITELLSADLLDGKSLAKIGYTAFDEEAQIFREALKNTYKAIIYRLDTGGTKATATILASGTDGTISADSLTATAKYAGIIGNKISIVVIDLDNDAGEFEVVTLFDGVEKDRQVAKKVEDLDENDWVKFSGTGDLIANAGTTLASGTNGTISAGTYADYLNAMKSYKWNTMAIPQGEEEANGIVKSNIVTYITNMRENLGKKVQAVMFNVAADYEGIISTSQGYKTVDETISPEVFVAYVAGLTAGSDVDTSNTYHAINGAISIVYPEGVTPYGD